MPGIAQFSGNATSTAAPSFLSSSELQVAAAAVDGNSGTSRLGSLEFNTPYAHEIVALAAVLVVVATASIALAVKFTNRRRPPVTHHHQLASSGGDGAPGAAAACMSDTDVDRDDIDMKDQGGRECIPIMHRSPDLHRCLRHSYESLRQRDSSACGGVAAVFRLSARVDEANRLLCLHGMQVWIRSASGEDQQAMDGRRIAIDIVTQTDVECRQTRLQARLVAAAADDTSCCADFGEDSSTIVAAGGWRTEPLDDVLAVKLSQNQSFPLRGQLTITVLGQRQPSDQLSMANLWGATISLDRIREPSRVTSLSVTLQDRD